MNDYTETVRRWLIGRGCSADAADQLLAMLDAGDWVPQPRGSLDDMLLSLTKTHRQYERVSEGLLAVLERRMPRKVRAELEDLQLELWNTLGKTRDTLCVYGFGDLGEPRLGGVE